MADASLHALDIGSSSVRALVFDDLGEPVPTTESVRRHEVGPDGTLDPDSLLADTRAVMAESLRTFGAPVSGVAASCFWHSLLALDASGRPLTPILTWRDVRAAAQARALGAQLDTDAVRRRTGAPLHPSFWPAKLAWLRAAEPAVFAAARSFVSFADWLLFEETGALRSSVSMASGTGLWSEAGWDAELLGALGIDEARLPPVSDEPVAGWYPPLGDGACSNVGAGCISPDRAALMIGTSGALRIVTTGSPAAPAGLFRYRLDAARAVVGGALSAGGNLHAWLVRTLRIDQTHGLAGRPAAAHGLTFVPSLGGERSPTWDASARGAIHGLSFDTTVADIAQAALEAVAYRFAAVAERLPDVREVVATGAALARNDDWAQMLADVLERPVIRSAEPEASARGAAMAIRERLGLAVPPARLGRTIEPRSDRFAAHREARERLEQGSPERAMDIPS